MWIRGDLIQFSSGFVIDASRCGRLPAARSVSTLGDNLVHLFRWATIIR